MPVGWGRARVELGGTSGYRVGRGRGYRLGVVERHTVEPVLPSRGPLNGTAFRHVPRPEGSLIGCAGGRSHASVMVRTILGIDESQGIKGVAGV